MRELEDEIRFGRERAAEIESSLSENLDHLKENYRMMALRSVLGTSFVRSRLGLVGDLLLGLLAGEQSRGFLTGLFEKLGTRFSRLFPGARSAKQSSAEPSAGEDPASTSQPV